MRSGITHRIGASVGEETMASRAKPKQILERLVESVGVGQVMALLAGFTAAVLADALGPLEYESLSSLPPLRFQIGGPQLPEIIIAHPLFHDEIALGDLVKPQFLCGRVLGISPDERTKAPSG